MKNASWKKDPIGAIGSHPFDPMSRFFKRQDSREQEHVTRRRRLSIQSSVSADGMVVMKIKIIIIY